MAPRARLSPPREARESWPWHQAKVTALSASLFMSGERRMEAENYLAGGYGIRLALEAKANGWAPIAKLATITQPPRLKGIQVSRDHGTGYLAATQVFDLRPVARKWLSLDQIEFASELFVANGAILVTRSGSVGRATLAYSAHAGVLVSDDLLRVGAKDPDWSGWLYGYLRSPQARAMMTASQYGHIIKHLEVSHLDAIPIPLVREDLRKRFREQVDLILSNRCEAHELTLEAERRFAELFAVKGNRVTPFFTASAREMFGGRRRLEGSRFDPNGDNIVAAFKRAAKEVVALSSVTQQIFVPGRFKHVYGDGGTPYLDSADILEVNPDVAKRVLSLTHEEQKEYRVESGWLLMPCSGQVYGNIGHTILATQWHAEKVLSNHIMRICPNDRIRAGYLRCVLGHPQLGRPLIVRFAFGSSVPEIAPEDVGTVPVPRLEESQESELADLMEKAAKSRDAADAAEQALAQESEQLIDKFLAGNRKDFIDRLPAT
jgi:type I restriction enzyme S subunit